MYLNLKEARFINERIRLCKSLFFLFGFEARSSFVDFVSKNWAQMQYVYLFFIPFKFDAPTMQNKV